MSVGRKIGRNDPCPCGSGKKYKKCCERGDAENIAGTGKFNFEKFSAYREKTGTIIDESTDLFEQIMVFSHKLMQSDKEGYILKRVVDSFDRNCDIGDDISVPVILFLNWLHLDYRFGQTLETVCERFMKGEVFEILTPRKQDIVRKMAESYAGFYEVAKVRDDEIIFKEISDGKRWAIHKTNEPFEKDAVIGDIWHMRFVDLSGDTYIYPPHFIFPPRFKQRFVETIEKRKKLIVSQIGGDALSEEDILKGAYKKMVGLWYAMPDQEIAEA